MYIYHKQSEIMQKKFNETAQTANFTDSQQKKRRILDENIAFLSFV